jgi:hypothetical protein
VDHFLGGASTPLRGDPRFSALMERASEKQRAFEREATATMTNRGRSNFRRPRDLGECALPFESTHLRSLRIQASFGEASP